ncbi:Pilin component protein (plasmid) [Sodalis praecaptivus]|uniref:Pilin component protein n=2 Tax=Sodalis praecaptivus TaxID=1239307 RepID=W0HZB2_9GAMM|nr:Pilin component protein [Sodalis praecaptivus]
MLSGMKAKKIFIGFPMRCRHLISDQRGVTTIEYALIGVAMALLITMAVGKGSVFSDKMKLAFDNIGNGVANATSQIDQDLVGGKQGPKG